MIVRRIKNFVDLRIGTFINERSDISINRKIVVIESDDWGSIRMPSREILNKLRHRFEFDKCNYCSYDSILTNDDLELLCEMLLNYKDKIGNVPIITTNFVTSNPDFYKIKEAGFNEYYNESILDTLKKYPNIDFDNINQAIRANLLKPQLHGREHLNVKRWLSLLQADNKEFILAFNSGMFGLSTSVTKNNHESVMAAFDMDSNKDLAWQRKIICEAILQFKELFGFYSKSFIAPNYVWDRNIEEVLANNGVKYMQGGRLQNIPLYSKTRKKFHYMGEENVYSQLYLVRNVIFEPSSNPNLDWVNKCLYEIERKFKNNIPVIICSHRVNFSGRIVVKNRDNSLRQFSNLLQSIIARWPDVEFMSSDELGDVIIKHKHAIHK